jgi:hypothetical protein
MRPDRTVVTTVSDRGDVPGAGASESGCHAWRGRSPSPRARENARLAVEIKAAHERTRQTYGPERRRVASAGLTPQPFVAVLNSRNPLCPMVK